MKDIQPDQFEEVYDSNVVSKLIDYYETKGNLNDYYEAFANFIACYRDNKYEYGVTIANETLHRQGKNRKRFDSESYKLSKFYESEQYLNDSLDEAFLEIIQQFIILSSIEIKNAEESNRSSIIKFEKNSVKTLMVLIFNANLYELLSKLELPRYITNSVNNLLTTISQSRNNIFNEYKDSLKEKGYENLIDTVDRIGMDEFFMQGGSKSIEMFNKFFKDKFDEIGSVNSDTYNELLVHYESYKTLYHSMYDKISIKDIIPYFNTSDNHYSVGIYDDKKPYVIKKLNNIAENLGDESVINRLIYHEG